MKGRTTLILAVIFAGLLLYVLKYQRGEPRKEKQIFRFDTERVAKVELKYEGDEGKDTVVLERDGDTWQIVQPIKAKGSTEDVDRVVSDFAGMEFGTTFTKEEAAKLTKDITGLDTPKFTAQAWDAKGKLLGKIVLGKDAAVGSKSYALVNDDYTVAVSTWSLDGLKKKADDLRDKSVVEIAEDDDVDTVEVKYADTSFGVRRIDEDNWRLTKPVEAEGDEWECKDLLREIKDLKVEKFVEQEEGKTPADYGLAEPQLVATVTMKKGAKQALKLGSAVPDDDMRLYAAAEGRPEIFEVANSILENLRKTPDDLREKSLFDVASSSDVERLEIVHQGQTFVARRTGDDAFELEKPKIAKCDYGKIDDILWRITGLRAEKFVDEKPKDLKQYGLDKPMSKVTFRADGNDFTVLLGGAKDDMQYAKRADRPNVVLVRQELLKELPRKAEDLTESKEEEAPETPPVGAPAPEAEE